MYIRASSLPARFETEAELNRALAEPTPDLVEMMRRLDGDLVILGIAGKMGVSLGELAVNAIRAAGVKKRVIGVARFSEKTARRTLEDAGVETVACDLLDRAAVQRLPEAANVLFMAGRKFGTDSSEDLTWAMNVLAPAHCAERYARSRIVAFSTGCVYPLVPPDNGGCVEAQPPAPVGDYAQSCLGRERIFGYYSRQHGTPVCLLRVNYAVDLRYGVLHDIGSAILRGEPVDVSAPAFNCLWQGDANRLALRALEHTTSPPAPLNATGPELVSTREVAVKLGKLLDRPVTFGTASGTTCYLSNAGLALGKFGQPRVGIEQLLQGQADWLLRGGRSLGKPTHFQVTDGKF